MDDGFDATTVIRRYEAAPGAGRVQQLVQNDEPEDGLQRLVVHAAATQTLMTCSDCAHKWTTSVVIRYDKVV